LGVAPPLAGFEVGREMVKGGVERIEQFGFNGVLENQVAVEIEQEIVQRGRVSGFHSALILWRATEGARRS